MSQSLFRQEALESKQTLNGSVSLFTPPYRWLMVALTAIIAVATAAYLVLGSYTNRESVVGRLVPTNGVLSIVPFTSGSVTRVWVSEGQSVKKGEALVTISSDVATDLGDTREMVGEQLQLQRLRLKKDLSGHEQLSSSELSSIRDRMASLRGQLNILRSQREFRVQQAALARSRADRLASVRDKGYVALIEIEQQESAAIDAAANLQEMNRQILDIEGQVAQCEQSLREQPLKSQTEQNDMERQLADVQRLVAENEAQRVVVLRAPQDGTIGTILVKQGQTLASGQTAVAMLPAGSLLEADLMVPSRAIGFVHPGQQVVLRYQAYPYQKFGQQKGRVTSISHTALSPQELAQQTGTSGIQEQHYRVSVALDRQSIKIYGRDEELRSGMALDADLIIDKRRLIEWVLEPLFAIRQRAVD